MDINEAIQFVFDDEKWVSKILLATVISLIPFFGGIAVTGYAIAILRNTEKGASTPLPSWDRIGEHFVDGLMFWVATLIYSVPFLILICPIALVWLLPAMGGERQEVAGALATLAGIVSAGLGCLAFLYAILLWVITPVLQIRYAETGELGACLRFRDIFRFLGQNIGDIVIAQIIVLAASFVVSTVLSGIIGVLSLVPFCGWAIGALLGLVMLPVGVWLIFLAGHLYGQIGRKAKRAPVA